MVKRYLRQVLEETEFVMKFLERDNMDCILQHVENGEISSKISYTVVQYYSEKDACSKASIAFFDNKGFTRLILHLYTDEILNYKPLKELLEISIHKIYSQQKGQRLDDCIRDIHTIVQGIHALECRDLKIFQDLERSSEPIEVEIKKEDINKYNEFIKLYNNIAECLVNISKQIKRVGKNNSIESIRKLSKYEEINREVYNTLLHISKIMNYWVPKEILEEISRIDLSGENLEEKMNQLCKRVNDVYRTLLKLPDNSRKKRKLERIIHSNNFASRTYIPQPIVKREYVQIKDIAKTVLKYIASNNLSDSKLNRLKESIKNYLQSDEKIPLSKVRYVICDILDKAVFSKKWGNKVEITNEDIENIYKSLCRV